MIQGNAARERPLSDLALRWADRPVSAMQTPRRFLDFVVDGESLFERLGKQDYITQLGWTMPHWQEVVIEELLLLRQPDLLAQPELTEGRQALYVCPECGDLNCGAISAVVSKQGNHIVWQDFAYYTPLNFDGEQQLAEPSVIRDGYEDLGPFVFDATSYTETLQAALKMLKRRPDDPRAEPTP